MPKVSVCIPSFNHEKYVRHAIESVLAQSFQDHEIVVTDDGSTDRTPDEVRSIADPRVSLEVLPQNYGACIALNSSIRRSKGEYVAILNSDDLFLPGKLEQQVRFLDDHHEVGAVFGYPSFVDEAGTPLADGDTFYGSVFKVDNRTRAQWLRHFFLRSNVLCHPAVLIRRRCYDDVGYYDPALAQLPDLDMWVRLIQRYEIYVIQEPLVAFRILKNNLNASAPRPDVIARLEWEGRQILEHYMALDERLLVEAFPELSDRVEWSTPPNWIAKLAHKMLERYLHRDAAGSHIETQASIQRRRPALWCLGELALTVGRPSHVSFAFDAMYRALARGDAVARHRECYRELITYTGSYDPYAMLRNLPRNRRLA
jgi:glycosyltransferase involved in cell wall biosynthesis